MPCSASETRYRFQRPVAPILLVAVIASTALLHGCGGSSASPMVSPTTATSPPSPAALSITTKSLPGGTVGSSYSAALAASGGTTPYSWSLTSGTLPGGLALNASTGAITGTPTAAASTMALTFDVKDSSNPPETASESLSLNIAAAPVAISVAVSPQRAALTVNRTLSLTATTNDGAGVNWSASPAGGSFNPAASKSGAAVTFTAPATAGAYTITATSVTDTSKKSSITVGVTDLPGVYTYHNDAARDGLNSQEYALSPSTVNTTSFGKLFSCVVDGAIYAQPLWVANLQIGAAMHSVAFIATAHDSLFAFDADTSPCVTLWSVSLIDTNHGGSAGETTVPAGSSNYLVGLGNGDMAPEVGVTGTPVIDPAAGTLYVVSKSVSSSGTTFYQRLHAIDLLTGNEKPGSPVLISATFPGTGDGGTVTTFDARQQNQRPGLALVNGTVYISWASHEDAKPYYGWVIGYTYNGTTFTQSSVLNISPNVGQGGIWMSGGAPAADASGNLYLITGNAVFDATSTSPPNNDYGDSLLELSSGLSVLQYFTPTDQQTDDLTDDDFGAGGAAVLADLPAGSPVTHLVIGGGENGNLYVLNRDALGGLGDSNAWQEISIGTQANKNNGGVIYSTGALWNDNLYIAGGGYPLADYQLNPTTGKFTLATTTTSPAAGFGFPGSTPSISSTGTQNAVVWALDNSQFCTPQSPGCAPAVLHAYDATNVTKELWNSSMVSTDAAGYPVKFTVPTVANGKIYVGTRGNNTGGVDSSTTTPGELDVYGLKPN